jgi:hypothetical protein
MPQMDLKSLSYLRNEEGKEKGNKKASIKRLFRY